MHINTNVLPTTTATTTAQQKQTQTKHPMRMHVNTNVIKTHVLTCNKGGGIVFDVDRASQPAKRS